MPFDTSLNALVCEPDVILGYTRLTCLNMRRFYALLPCCSLHSLVEVSDHSDQCAILIRLKYHL
jgi:hypothetical protein